MNLRRCVPSFGFSRRRVWRDVPVVAVFASFVFDYIISLMYMEVWCMLRRVAALTFCLS